MRSNIRRHITVMDGTTRELMQVIGSGVEEADFVKRRRWVSRVRAICNWILWEASVNGGLQTLQGVVVLDRC